MPRIYRVTVLRRKTGRSELLIVARNRKQLRRLAERRTGKGLGRKDRILRCDVRFLYLVQ